MNLKKLGIVLILMIAVIGMSLPTVSANDYAAEHGEHDNVGEPNSIAVAFMNTYHGHGFWVNGNRYARHVWNMGYAVHIVTEEFNRDGIQIDGTDHWYHALSYDFYKKFKLDTTKVKFYVTNYADKWADYYVDLPADGSSYGGVCANTLSYKGGNFKIKGTNGLESEWVNFS